MQRHESARDLASIDRVTFNWNEKQEAFGDTWLPFTSIYDQGISVTVILCVPGAICNGSFFYVQCPFMSYWPKLNKALNLEFTCCQYNVKGEGIAASALCKINQQQ